MFEGRPGFGKLPGPAKFFFSREGINTNGIRRFDAARCLWCSGYLPYWQPADHLDVLKGVEKQSGGTKGISTPTSPFVVPIIVLPALGGQPQLLVFYTHNV